MSIATFLIDMVKPLVAKAVISLGFGTVTYVGLSAALDAVLGAAKSSLGGLSGDVASLVAMTGFFMAISILAGALTTYVALQTLKKFALRTGT